MAPFHLRIPAILLTWTWYLEYRVAYVVEDIRTFHDGRRGEGTVIYYQHYLKSGGERIYLQIHDFQRDSFPDLILESKVVIWAILVAAVVVVDELSATHLSVSIRPGKIVVIEL